MQVCACAGADVAISLKPKNDTYPNTCVAMLGNTQPISQTLSSSSDINAYGPSPSYITNPGGCCYPSTATVSTAGA